MVSIALLVLRAVIGGLMAGHGAQKLFGSFGGYGLEGTGGYMESLNLKPGKRWAQAAGWSEFGGGVLTVLGLLSPLGPLGMIGSMAMATRKVHWNKPIWNTEGGAELPVVNIAASSALILAGPGKLSLDTIFRTKLPIWFVPVGLAAIGGTVAYAVQQDAIAAQAQGQDPAQAQSQAPAQPHDQSEVPATGSSPDVPPATAGTADDAAATPQPS